MFNHAVSRSGAILESEAIISAVNHVGLCIGNGLVIEASQKNGVVERQLNDFLSEASHNVVVTIKETELVYNAIQRARSCIGLPYNDTFQPDAEGFYCSELITYSFKTKQGADYFQQYPMNFCDPVTNQVLAYWVEYYHHLKQSIPHGVLGSHPQQLLRQTYLFQMVRLLE